MATTTNYSWTTPDNTAYVKDGASAIRTLGSSVDTTLFGITGGKNVSSATIYKATLTAQSTINLTSIFVSNYTNYQIVLKGTYSGTASGIQLRMRLGSTDAIGATDYAQIRILKEYAAAVTGDAYNTSAWNVIGAIGALGSSNNIQLFNPNVAIRTTVNSNYVWFSSGMTNGETGMVGGIHNQATAYDGCSILVPTGTFTGTIEVIGIRGGI